MKLKNQNVKHQNCQITNRHFSFSLVIQYTFQLFTKTTMALLDLCRLDEKINLKPVDSLASFQNDVLGYSQNFVNSAQLANPPFSNVRLL